MGRGKGEKPVLDVSYLLDHVMERVLPLQWDKVLNSSTPLKVAASSIDDGGNPILLEDFRDKDDLVECLRASASVPGIAQGPIHHRGHTLVDALLYEPIPIWSAIDDGCTHILVLSTKPKLEGQKIMNRLSTTFVRNFFMTPKYLDKKLYIESDTSARGAKTTEGLLAIDDPIESLKVFGANVYTVFPDSNQWVRSVRRWTSCRRREMKDIPPFRNCMITTSSRTPACLEDCTKKKGIPFVFVFVLCGRWRLQSPCIIA